MKIILGISGLAVIGYLIEAGLSAFVPVNLSLTYYYIEGYSTAMAVPTAIMFGHLAVWGLYEFDT